MFQYADYIYAVYEEKSFTKAAKRLYISQPALSAAIKRAEEKLGFVIFDRSSHSLALTDSGHVYITAVENMRKVKTELQNYVENVRSLNYGDVVVGCADHVANGLLPALLHQFRELYPGIRLLFRTGDLSVLRSTLLEEKSDVLIDSDITDETLTALPLMRERILLAVPRGYPLRNTLPQGLSAEDIRANKHLTNQTSTIDLSTVKEEHFILSERDAFAERCNRIFEEASFVPYFKTTTSQMSTAVAFAEKGIGLTFVTDTFVRFTNTIEGLDFYTPNTPLAEQTLFIAHKKGGYLSPVVKAWVDFLCEKL